MVCSVVSRVWGMLERCERLLQVGDGLPIGCQRHGPQPGLAEIGDRLLPQLPAEGVVGQQLGLLGNALRPERRGPRAPTGRVSLRLILHRGFTTLRN